MNDVPPDFLAFLQEEESRSRNDDLLANAETALKSYNGDLYGDEEDGRSQVVSRDVAEVVDQRGSGREPRRRIHPSAHVGRHGRRLGQVLRVERRGRMGDDHLGLDLSAFRMLEIKGGD